ncbi:ABC transporter substrate-binding protein [Beggiatoa leptomitoformis]|uniref:ABC transporter substrate-binding protein n=1 Tax=Beggiatoa leptomitoformis TaxID=288004 RepID=A0A2N9YJR5_9GAMM|nr:ABC transporter substrate binding protein [Beggiatoa leptomitoformis]ALG66658.2 ABC transporter substrate-binding protein [Beggiatoa leptomitoformis]AUI70526.1 ABC transporter substrate-binding protein [Beggiatoa leptomitoformis]
MLKILLKAIVICLIIIPIIGQATEEVGKKILFVDSYNKDFEWSNGILQGIQQTLAAQAPTVTLHTFHMDTKQHPDESSILAAVNNARAEIDRFKPDVVITCDDNAVKYLLVPYYKDVDLPVVFCGVNWDASIYGLPYRNATGMLEISLMGEIVQHLKQYAKGDKIGYLAEDATSRKNTKYTEKLFNIHYNKVYFVKSVEEFKEKFIQLQTEVDMLIIDNINNLKGLNKDELSTFVVENIKIPSGTDLVWNADYCLIVLGKIPEEQGEWATETALKILAGAKPSDIPIVQNKRGKLYINLKLGNKLHIPFSPALLKMAEIIK